MVPSLDLFNLLKKNSLQTMMDPAKKIEISTRI